MQHNTYSVAFYTLGCRVNQYETRAVEEAFLAKGFTIGSFDEKCDVYVINTCTVTAESDRKSRQIIRRARKIGGENALVLAMGCMIEVDPEQAAAVHGLDLAIGNRDKTALADAAVKLLYDDDGKEGADDGHPQRSVNGQAEHQQYAGDTCGKIVYRAGLLHKLAVAPLEEHCRCNAYCQKRQNLKAELIYAECHCRHKGDDNVEHNARGVGLGSYLRLIGSVKRILFCFHFFSASFAAASALAFSSAAFAANRSLAVLNECVSGILPGQL